MLNLIKASAGSGKTFNLTRVYLQLLLGEKQEDGSYRLAENGRERHKHILAITFTNKATAEMKSRIVKELITLSNNPEKSAHLDMLCETLHTNKEKLTKTASKALQELLFDYSNFNISTIDSFFQIILRTFAREANQNINYNIELSDNYAVSIAVARFLSDIGHNRRNYSKEKENAISKWILDYINDKINENQDWNIFNPSSQSFANSSPSLVDMAGELNKEHFRAHIAEINEYLNRSDFPISKFSKALAENIAIIKKEGIDSIIAVGNRISKHCGQDDFRDIISKVWLYDRYTDAKNGNNILTDSKSKTEIPIVLEKIESDSIFKKKYKIDNLNDEDKKTIIDKLDTISKLRNTFLILKSIQNYIYVFGLLGEISTYLQEYKTDNNVILLSDTNELLKDIIQSDGSNTPFIYECVGIKLRNFLIDEFQDTSKVQWNNIHPLLLESLGNGHDDLIIGDAKQCIYRFRNSEPSLIQSGVKNIFRSQVNESSLDTNWRSSPNIINFNNDFFTYIADELKQTDTYNEVKQLTNSNNDYDGYVEIDISDPENEEIPDKVTTLIAELHSRGYKYKDIAVLVNTNAQGACIISNILNKNKEEGATPIDVISDESLLLCNSPSVRLIISNLRYLNGLRFAKIDEDDSSIDKGAVSSYERHRTMEEKKHRMLCRYEYILNTEKGIEPGVALLRSFHDIENNIDLKNPTNKVITDADSTSLISVVESIIRTHITDVAKENENAYIQAFMDCVIDFTSLNNGSINSFLKWWDNKKDKISISSPDGIDAVNVMTTHKSKGLEFKCVIVPFCNWNFPDKKANKLWVTRDDYYGTEPFNGLKGLKKEDYPPYIPIKLNSSINFDGIASLERCKQMYNAESINDQMNRAYVAFTRPQNELYIFAPKPAKAGNDISTYLVQFCNNMVNVTDNNNARCTKSMQQVCAEDKHQTFTIGEKLESVPVVEEKVDEVTQMPSYKTNNNERKVDYVITDAYNDNQERGIIMHNVLSRITDINSIEYSSKLMIKRGIITQEDWDSVSEQITAGLNSDVVKEWFVPGIRCYNERTIVGSDKKDSRPDRYVVTKDCKNIIIDYKFGDKTNVKEYHNQVKGYMNLLKQLGKTDIEGYIWYPLTNHIEKVDF